MHQRTRLPHRRGLRVRTGFTILEMLISTTLVLGILTIASNLFRRQSQSLSDSAGRLEAQQNARFGLATLDRELRVAGVGIPDAQPLLVQADRMGFTFNADYVSRVPNDPGAVYIDPDTDSASTLVFRRADRTYLPLSTFTYPESTYLRNAGVPSGAETISFYLARDPQSAATNEHILYRRVNAGTPRIVARGIIVNPADTVFQYFKTVDTTGALAAIPANQLPLYHRAHLHGATNDTGVNARIDSIRSVRVRFAAVHRDRRIGEVVRRLDLTIHLMNAGLVRRTTCGEHSRDAGLDCLDRFGRRGRW
jgi:type II secretory pathway pseudopilin PulG